MKKFEKKVAVITGGANGIGSSDEISHVLQAIRLEEDYALGTIRIPFGKNNTQAEMLELVEFLSQIIAKGRK